MMMEEYMFLCPRCGREAEVCCAALIRFISRLELPYFVCVPCQTTGYDKRLTMRQVSRLRKMDGFAKEVPFRTIYQMAKTHLEKIMEHRTKNMSYEYARFRRVKRSDPP